MARLNIVAARKQQEMDKIVRESDDIKKLSGSISAAHVNKHRAA